MVNEKKKTIPSHRLILALAIPNILATISTPLMGFVDTALVGHLDRLGQLDGVVGATVLFDSALILFGFFRMGTTGVTAQSFGAGKIAECREHLLRSVIIAFFLGLIFFLLRQPLGLYGLSWTDVAPASVESAQRYFAVRIWGFPAALINLCFFGWFLGLGRVRHVMGLVVIGNMVNLFGSITLVHGLTLGPLTFPRLGVEGSALATALSLWLTLLLNCIFAFQVYRKLRRNSETARLDWGQLFTDLLKPKELRRIFQINTDLFIRTIALVFAITFSQVKAAQYGGDLFAGFNLALRLQIFTAYFVDGFAHAAEILVGHAIGRTALDPAAQKNQFRETFRRLVAWGVGTGLFLGILFVAFWQPIFHLLTHHQSAIDAALPMLPWTFALILVGSYAYVLDGIMVGATRSGAMRNTMVFGLFFVYLPVWYLSTEIFGLGIYGFWLALIGINMTRNIGLTKECWKIARSI